MTSTPSPRYYRTDSFDSLSVEMRTYLDTHFLANLQNRNTHNPKVLVVFSGGNAVGKSSLSEKIQSELGAVILENDTVKLHILRHSPTVSHDELQRITWGYTMDLYSRASQDITNGLIVRDGVIDWYYDRILPIFQKQGYSLFIVAYELSRSKQEELIRKRGDKPTVGAARLIALLDDHEIHQRRFRSMYHPDIILNDDTLFDHDKVISLLRQKIQGLS